MGLIPPPLLNNVKKTADLVWEGTPNHHHLHHHRHTGLVREYGGLLPGGKKTLPEPLVEARLFLMMMMTLLNTMTMMMMIKRRMMSGCQNEMLTLSLELWEQGRVVGVNNDRRLLEKKIFNRQKITQKNREVAMIWTFSCPIGQNMVLVHWKVTLLLLDQLLNDEDTLDETTQ